MDFFKLVIVLALIVLTMYSFSSRGDWRTASRESAGIAPDPALTSEAVLHVYGADAWGWRGWFAVHTWIAAKRRNEDHYVLYDVIGWRGYNGQTVMGINRDIPDRYWYGAKPRLLKAHQGPAAEALIEAVDAASDGSPAYYMVNCAHPTHFDDALSRDAWSQRIRGLRANASTLSHAELDEAPELDRGDPQELSIARCETCSRDATRGSAISTGRRRRRRPPAIAPTCASLRCCGSGRC